MIDSCWLVCYVGGLVGFALVWWDCVFHWYLCCFVVVSIRVCCLSLAWFGFGLAIWLWCFDLFWCCLRCLAWDCWFCLFVYGCFELLLVRVCWLCVFFGFECRVFDLDCGLLGLW